ncbi:MAG: hypothetical protein ACLFWM_12635 [Actinomycetota bacterium]
MSGGSVVILGGVLFALLCVIVGALVWQEAKRRPDSSSADYVVDDAIRYIVARLPPEVARRMGATGVRRVIEWELYYLQGLAQEDRRNPVETVAGGSDASIDYVTSRIAEVHGATYDRADVADVLRLEADYLFSIGAVGEPVETRDEGDEEP